MLPILRRKPAVLIAAVALLLAVSATAGEKPPYQVLQNRPCGECLPTSATPYAYGWFGAGSRTHAVRQTGYYRNYTQWSFR